MVKNKKKSISKIIVSNPISNGLNNDEASNIDELHTTTPALDVNEHNSILDEPIKVYELSELVKNTLPIITSNPTEDTENKQIQSEPTETTPIIEPTETTQTIETIETSVKNLREHELTSESLEKTENIKDDINLSEQKQISNNIDDKSDNIELTEIQIKNEETNTSEKKSSGCSRGWCSIL
jgi:hypothetical protein